MYGFFYPETNKQARAIRYESVEDAKLVFTDVPSWNEISSTNEKDLGAFMNSVTGDILVIREIA